MRSWILCSLVCLVACDCEGESTSSETPETPVERPGIDPLPEVEVNMDKVYLGRRLFHDPVLSGDGSVSCATCHSLDHGGAEARATSEGIGGQVGPINSPTVLNAHFNFRQFWDGRAEDLAEQAAGPIENPLEMGGSFEDVPRNVAEDEWYATRFASIYGEDDPVTKEHIIDAIAEYERYLLTPSPFDRYARGDESALNEQQQRGYALFRETGCTTCHQGVNAGGTMYQKMGVVENYFELRGGELTDADMGRFNVTNDEAHRHFFKVPTLRNIALTPPYFHDGTQENLEDAVRIMARVQLGQTLEDAQIADIVAFLGSLTGELPEHARLPEADAIPERVRTGEPIVEHPETGEDGEEVLEPGPEEG